MPRLSGEVQLFDEGTATLFGLAFSDKKPSEPHDLKVAGIAERRPKVVGIASDIIASGRGLD